MSMLYYQHIFRSSDYTCGCTPDKKNKNLLTFKERKKSFMQGKTPYYFPTLNRILFAKSNKKAIKMCRPHVPNRLNRIQTYLYVISGNVIGFTKPIKNKVSTHTSEQSVHHYFD
jgi:hypothetical protein